MADGVDGWRCVEGIERYRESGWLARRLHGRGAKGTGPGDSRDPGPTPVIFVGTRSKAVPAWGGRRYCGREWLTCGVRLAATAGEAEGRVGVSSVLGRLAGPGAAARRLGWLVGRAG